MKLGIPRAFLFYRYKYFWEEFFSSLGFSIVFSDFSNKNILENGKKIAVSEDCIAFKMFLGHVNDLVNKCDYILIPRIESLGFNNIVCTKFNGLYDIVKTLFSSIKIIDYNIDVLNGINEYDEIKRIGKMFNFKEEKIKKSYLKAKQKQKMIEESKIIEQDKKLLNNDKKKILIISHPYNIHDNFLGDPIVKKLKSLDICVLYADYIPKDIALENSEKLLPNLYWIYNKEIIGAINYYLNKIDGIIFLTSFPCGCDALVNDLVMRKIKIPILNLIIDEHQEQGGMETRIESFIDVINERVRI